MADESFYADKESFDAAMKEYSELKQRIPGLEEEWFELSSQIEDAIIEAGGTSEG